VRRISCPTRTKGDAVSLALTGPQIAQWLAAAHEGNYTQKLSASGIALLPSALGPLGLQQAHRLQCLRDVAGRLQTTEPAIGIPGLNRLFNADILEGQVKNGVIEPISTGT
jgi:hypothetical protein